MTNRQEDPIEAWRDVSASAAASTGYRAGRAAGRGSVLASIGTMTVALAVVVVALMFRPTSGIGTTGPVTATAEDGMFRLELTTPRGIYGPDDAIEPVATVTYLGPDADVRIFHSTHPIGFLIEEVGGERTAGGGTRLPCRSTHLMKGEPFAQPFWKGGSPDEPFDQAWYEDPVLRLPPGTWRIVAMLNSKVGDGCTGEAHRLEVANVIQVVDGLPSPVATPAFPAPSSSLERSPTATDSGPAESPSAEPAESAPSEGPVTGAADDGMFRLELTTPSGIYGPDDAIEPVARLTYVGPSATVTFGHSDPAVSFTIGEVGGSGRQMTGGADDVCLSTTLRRGEASTIRFHKSGQTDMGFDLAWFQDPVLRLPPGTWRIRVSLEAYVPECGLDADIHKPTVENIVLVR